MKIRKRPRRVQVPGVDLSQVPKWTGWWVEGADGRWWAEGFMDPASGKPTSVPAESVEIWLQAGKVVEG